MEQRRTYLISPNLTFLPGGPLALGNVIAQPLKPHRALAKLPEEAWPATTEASETSRRVLRARSAEVHGGLNADAAAVLPAGAHASVGRGGSSTREYSMETLRTVYYAADPSAEAIRELVATESVRYAMNAPYWTRPVYIVSGIKIASGLIVRQTTARTAGAAAGASLEAAPGLAIGADVGFDRARTDEDQAASQQDVILAYQLLRITRRGRMKRRTKVDEFEPKDAFLSDGVAAEDDTVETESHVVVDDGQIAALDDIDVDETDVLFLERAS